MAQYSIGSDHVPGLSKLIEECGEVTQVAGKIIGLGGLGDHWDGSNMRERLTSELGDLYAAIMFVINTNGLDRGSVIMQANRKQDLFEKWHRDAQPSPLAHASTSPGPVNCNARQRFQQPNDAIPRSCRRCALGPCPFFNQDGSSKL